MQDTPIGPSRSLFQLAGRWLGGTTGNTFERGLLLRLIGHRPRRLQRRRGFT
ncbi:hypothetical protein ABT009_41775 [Streptomyces sp. NPDC002896]|uniref:hypothetical protein n=1 Tax=Streptomyces sp. NPDC002896 TaxID=3154438 RepID=UPI00331B351E